MSRDAYSSGRRKAGVPAAGIRGHLGRVGRHVLALGRPGVPAVGVGMLAVVPGPGQGACVGLNKTRSPPCMRCRGPCLASPHWPASCLAFPMPRAARQSQEPARGPGFPAPPTSRSYLRAVPVSNGERISTASARDRATPLPHHFPAFFAVHTLSTEYGWLSAFNVGFPPPYTQSVHRLPGVTPGTPGCQASRGAAREIPPVPDSMRSDVLERSGAPPARRASRVRFVATR